MINEDITSLYIFKRASPVTSIEILIELQRYSVLQWLISLKYNTLNNKYNNVKIDLTNTFKKKRFDIINANFIRIKNNKLFYFKNEKLRICYLYKCSLFVWIC